VLRSIIRVIGIVGIALAAGASVLPQISDKSTPGPFDRLRFREIGPASMAGRIDDFAVLESNPAVFYVATATGGLWKTVNNGTTFETVFAGESTSSIGDVAVAPADANLVWIGTGENNNRQSSSWGDGLYRSADGGRTWKNMGLRESRHVARIIVDPVDHDVVYAAALGSLWGPGGDRGVFKTADGGLTWTKSLTTDDDTGATELVMDPSNNKVLYAATYQRRRATWGFNGGGPGSAIYKTTDAGRSWTKLTVGLPDGPKGRIGLDIYRRNPNVVYARIEHATESGVYRSDDAGATWRKLSSVNPRPMYFSQIRVDPQSDSRVYVLGVQLHVSDDGGRTFRNDGARFIHVDFHAMWIDPNNSSHLMIGGDGGVGISYDRSQTYVWLNNMPIGQFYHVAFDLQSPYTVCGGLQDNNTWCGPSAVRSRDGIGNDAWFIIGGGDGFVGLLDPHDPRILYAESQDGRMNRVDRVTNERKAIRPEPAEGQPAYRWNWDTPLTLSPHDPRTVFVAANKLFRSSDRGHSWLEVSPDLTNAIDRDELELMGVKGKDIRLAKHDGVGAYGTIVSFAESPKRQGLYYTGSDDGVVAVSRDAGRTWTRVTDKISGVPKNTYVSEVAPSRFDEGTVYATFDGHRLNDFGTYVYASADYGSSWRSIATGLPRGEVVRTLAEDLRNPDVLYLGTESGLFVTTDRARSWTRVKANLPTVPVYEIGLHPRDNDMILATHGRSLWVLDDLAPFQQHAQAMTPDAYLFEPGTVAHRLGSNERSRGFEGDRKFLGPNPAEGASITYRLRSAAKDVRLIVKDASGRTVRELGGEGASRATGAPGPADRGTGAPGPADRGTGAPGPADRGTGAPGPANDARAAGLNTVVWDLRVEPLPAPRGPQGPGGGGGFGGGGLNGPLVLPGVYTVALQIDGREAASATITVAGDPEIQITDADRRTHFDTVLMLHELQRYANDAAAAVTALDEQISSVKDRMKTPNVAADLKSAVDGFDKALAGVKPKLGVGGVDFGGGGFGGGAQNVRGRIGQLKGSIMASTSLPTETQTRQVSESRQALAKTIDEVNAVIARAGALYKQLAAANFLMEVPQPVRALRTGTEP
jgi:photosystem II stability/assembly factor-like uncharacterized protein